MAQDGTDWDWVGALTVASFIDDVEFLRKFAEAYANAMKKRK